MFDNVLFQTVPALLKEDLRRETLPNSMIFAGSVATGKFTCALELARVLSCSEKIKGEWNCTCHSCLNHKALVSSNLTAAGPRDCSLETAAARQTFICAAANGRQYIKAAQYLFVRSVRKLTIRFNPVLWQDDDKYSKIAPYLESIDELLEEIDPLRPLADTAVLEKKADALYSECQKLESSFLYDSLPVSHVRNISAWARYTSAEGKKAVIIENCDRMQESARNALLKILEEPPEGTVFILTTARRGAVMPTILSRVRTYAFTERTADQQKTVIDRVFHENSESIDQFMLGFLPVEPRVVQQLALSFLEKIRSGIIPDAEKIVKEAKSFEPRASLKLFLNTIFNSQRHLLRETDARKAAAVHAYMSYVSRLIRETYEHITIYNQSPSAALEHLAAAMIQYE